MGRAANVASQEITSEELLDDEGSNCALPQRRGLLRPYLRLGRRIPRPGLGKGLRDPSKQFTLDIGRHNSTSSRSKAELRLTTQATPTHRLITPDQVHLTGRP